MKTKEATKFLSAYREYFLRKGKIDEINKLLEEGKKYKDMWGDLEEDSCEFELIKNIKQKYFPPKKSLIEEAVDKSFDEVILKGIADFLYENSDTISKILEVIEKRKEEANVPSQ